MLPLILNWSPGGKQPLKTLHTFMLTSEAKNWHNHWFALMFPASRQKNASQIYSWWDSRKHLGSLLKLRFLLRVSPSDVNLALQNFPIWKSLLEGITRRPVSSKSSGGSSYFTQAEVQNHFVGKLHYEFYHPSIFHHHFSCTVGRSSRCSLFLQEEGGVALWTSAQFVANLIHKQQCTLSFTVTVVII